MNNRRREDPEYRTMLKELSAEQASSLHNLEKFGWQLKFIRHPLFQGNVVVLHDPDSDHYAVLDSSGDLNQEHDLQIRESRH